MTTRPEADRCPGLLRTFAADDGAMVRLRLPGGLLPLVSLTRLMEAALAHGAPFIQLTSRANLQVRGLPDPPPDEFVEAATEAGFLPHPTHERVRNLIASPWSTHRGELTELVAELDAAVCADPGLAELPGRWLMAVDDGSGQVLGLPYDVGYRRLGPREGVLLLAGGWSRPLGRTQVVPEITRLARDFVELRERLDPAPWTVAELPPDSPFFAGFTPPPTGRRDPGVLGDPGVLAPVLAPEAGVVGADLVATVPLGLLTPAQVEALADVASEVALTPWRRVVLPGAAGSGGAAARLAEAGLVVAPDSGWDRLTACIGAPYCRRTQVPTLQVASAMVEHVGDLQVHVSGCERRCGRPSTPHVDVLAPAGVHEAITHLEGFRRA